MLIKGTDYELVNGTEANPGNRKFRLLRDFPFFFRTTKIIIPEGFLWDGPSGVPLVWGLYKTWEQPALIHDYLYDTRGIIPNTDIVITRKEADELFFYMLLQIGVSSIFPFVMRTMLSGIFQKVWDNEIGMASDVVKKAFSPLTLVGVLVLAATFGIGFAKVVTLLPM